MKSHLPSAVSGSALALVMAAMVASPEALAVNMGRNFVQNAAGACQAALPAYEGLIRKRPLAVQNEGTALAFVTCSLMSTDRGVGTTSSITEVYVYADNNTGSPVNLTCTLVDGHSGYPNAFYAKQSNMPANSKVNEFQWSTVDNGGLNFDWTTNVSCGLPPGTGLTITFVYYDEDVGA